MFGWFFDIKAQYLVCSTSSIVSGRRTLFVSGSKEADSPAPKATREKTKLGRFTHTSSRSMIKGDTATPTRAIKEQYPNPFCLNYKKKKKYNKCCALISRQQNKKQCAFYWPHYCGIKLRCVQKNYCKRALWKHLAQSSHSCPKIPHIWKENAEISPCVLVKTFHWIY